MREARPIHPARAITVGIKAKDIIGIEHALIFDAEPIIVLPIAFRVCLGGNDVAKFGAKLRIAQDIEAARCA